EDDFSVRGKTGDDGVGAKVGQSPWLATFGRHYIDFGVSLVAATECYELSIARKRGVCRRAQATSESPRDSAARIDRPQIIFADEDDLIAENRRMPVVAITAHRSSPSKWWRHVTADASGKRLLVCYLVSEFYESTADWFRRTRTRLGVETGGFPARD